MAQTDTTSVADKLFHVVVIGAGPSGLSACRHLAANNDRFTFICYEQRRGIGGTWLATDHNEIGSEDKDEVESETYPKSLAGQRPFTAYKYLHTNLPAQHMVFPDYPYTPQHITEKQLTAEQIPWQFPAHYDVLNYFHSYAEHFRIMPHIRLDTQVDSIRLDPTATINKKYVIKTHDTKTGAAHTQWSDAVLVCSGHYARPRWPTGIKRFSDFKGRLLHAKYYHGPQQQHLENCRKILVLGGLVTGPDIILDIARQAPERDLLLAGHNESLLVEQKDDGIKLLKGTNIRNKPDIEEIIGSNSVKFIDGSIEDGIDAIICSTGFEYSFPFFEGEKGENPDTLISLTNTGGWLQPLYRDIVHINHAPTLCFIGLHHFGIGFLLMDMQSRYVVELMRGEFQLPSREQMLQKEQADHHYRHNEFNWPQHYSHQLFLMAQKYHDEIVGESHIEPLHEKCVPLFFGVCDRGLANPESFRRMNFEIGTVQEWKDAEERLIAGCHKQPGF